MCFTSLAPGKIYFHQGNNFQIYFFQKEYMCKYYYWKYIEMIPKDHVRWKAKIESGNGLVSHYLNQCWPRSMMHMVLLIVGELTHWGRVTHICVGSLTTIVSDNGLSPGRRQAIIWTNPGILLIGPWGTNFSEILIGIQTFSFKKMHSKMSSAKLRPFCLGLNVLN